jgi:hypothetical protein
MKKKIYVVYDSKAENYGNPMFFATRGEAIRMFSEECNRPESMVNKYPEDFTLFEIGTYNEKEDGLISAYINKSAIGCGVDFKRETPPLKAVNNA